MTILDEPPVLRAPGAVQCPTRTCRYAVVGTVIRDHTGRWTATPATGTPTTHTTSFVATYRMLRDHDEHAHPDQRDDYRHLELVSLVAADHVDAITAPALRLHVDGINRSTCSHCHAPLEQRHDEEHWLDLTLSGRCRSHRVQCERLCLPHPASSPDACGQCHGAGYITLHHEPDLGAHPAADHARQDRSPAA